MTKRFDLKFAFFKKMSISWIISYSIKFMRLLHIRFLSKITPRNVIEISFLISLQLIVKDGSFSGKLSLYCWLRTKIYFVLSSFRESLFAVNQLISSANITGSRRFDTLNKLFITIINNSSRRVEP